MSHLYWDRVRTELASTRQTRLVERTTTGTDASGDVRTTSLPACRPQLKGQDSDPAVFADTDPEEVDALLEHIALALSGCEDGSS